MDNNVNKNARFRILISLSGLRNCFISVIEQSPFLIVGGLLQKMISTLILIELAVVHSAPLHSY